jgi:hypothetical protein
MSASERSFPRGRGQAISCTNCGTGHIMYPPASEYVSIMLDPCPRADYQKSFFYCINCNKRNTFYWHKRHREHRYAT